MTDSRETQARERYAAVFGELLAALRAIPPSNELDGGMRDRLRAAVRAARELIRSENLRTRGEWHERGHLRAGKLYLEERDLRRLSRAEELLCSL